MKYSILDYNQQKLLKTNLDCVDLVILNYLILQLNNPEIEKEMFENDFYACITNDLILTDLPFLRLQERGLESRLKKLIDENFIDRKSKCINGTKLKQTYLKITPRSYDLKFEIDYNIDYVKEQIEKQIKSKEEETNNIPFDEIISYLNEKTKSNYRSNSRETKNCINARWRDGFRLDDFKKVIDVKSKEWLNTNMQIYLRPMTLFGTKFESYLNQCKEIQKYEKVDF